jgi:hypothetical protein
MMSDAKHAGRRTLLQRGLALVGGGAAVIAGARWTRAEAAPPKADTRTLTLYARKHPVTSAASDARLVASGDLYDTPSGGAVVGSLYTNCFCLGTPFGPDTSSQANLQFQVLHLKEGTLFGISGGGNAHGDITQHAIVGGTSRFAGATGTYVERPAGADVPDHGVVEIIVALA